MARSLYALLFFGVVACTSPGQPERPAEAALVRACGYLWAQQDDDGGWHSATHGLLRSGQALTPFILDALLTAPEGSCPAPQGGVNRALGFVRRHLSDEGVLGLADPDLLEYPNYATGYALRVLFRSDVPADTLLAARIRGYLLDQQFDERRGVATGHPAYGGWGFGEVRLPPGETGHVDLSHTRRIAQALRVSKPDSAAFGRLRLFLGRLQKRPDDPRLAAAGVDPTIYDGGFYYAPVVRGVNKSPPESRAPDRLGLFRSYATATADGLLALSAAGAPPDDPAVRDALAWLHRHPSLDAPPGLPEDDPRQWFRVLFFYHLAVRAEAYAVYGGPDGWTDAIVRLLVDRQREDGSFVNPYGSPNKEDDPLLATALAVQALTGVHAGR